MKKLHLVFVLLMIGLYGSSCKEDQKQAREAEETENKAVLPEEDKETPQLPEDLPGSLLEMSAMDFWTHQPPVPLDFRNVQLKYLLKPDGTPVFLLCGEFLHREGQQENWTPFVTIRTDPYEQWIGSSAQQYCRDSETIALSGDDLSKRLKAGFDLLRQQSVRD